MIKIIRKNLKRIVSVSILCTFISTILMSVFLPKSHIHLKDKTVDKVVHTPLIEPLEEDFHSASVESATSDIVASQEPITEVNIEEPESLEVETETMNEVEIVTEETTTMLNETETLNSNIVDCVWGNFTITMDEFDLLCTTVYCEAGNQDIDTQIMTCLTILNRYVIGYEDTIRDVIYAKGAYSVTSWSNFENRGWTESVEMAVQSALEVNNHPRDMIYFRTKHYHSNSYAKDYKKSGDLYFSTIKTN